MSLREALKTAAAGLLVVFAVLGVLMGAVYALRGRQRKKKPQVPEEVRLVGVSPERAAMIMAIVTDYTGKQLRFISIRALEEKDDIQSDTGRGGI